MSLMKSRPCRTALLALPLVLVMGGAHAANSDGTLTAQCDTYKTSYDRTYCVAKLFMASDKELNDVYGKLKARLKGDAQQGLVKVQRAWITYRNGACEEGGAIDVNCNYQVNRERTNYLRDRLRECETGSCNNGLIAKESWN